jgi:hypothetical protein
MYGIIALLITNLSCQLCAVEIETALADSHRSLLCEVNPRTILLVIIQGASTSHNCMGLQGLLQG